jgi:hypothetical protein
MPRHQSVERRIAAAARERGLALIEAALRSTAGGAREVVEAALSP